MATAHPSSTGPVRVPGRYLLGFWLPRALPVPWLLYLLAAVVSGVLSVTPVWPAAVVPFIFLGWLLWMRQRLLIGVVGELAALFDDAAQAAGALAAETTVDEVLDAAGVLTVPAGGRVEAVRAAARKLLDEPDCSAGHSTACVHRIDAASRAFWRAVADGSAPA